MTAFEPGWPCLPLQSSPPSVEDRLSSPASADLLPQILQLCPRGPAWGTDEAGDGQGAAPEQLLFWTAIAAWSAASYEVDFTLALQALPSAVTWSLAAWEAELGLPDPCTGPLSGTAARIAAIRAKFAGLGGQSPNYLICLAQALGIAVCEVEEFTPARIGTGIGKPLYGPAWGFAFRIHAPHVQVSYAKIGERCGNRLARWGMPVLECAVERVKPAHTVVLFAYDNCGV